MSDKMRRHMLDGSVSAKAAAKMAPFMQKTKDEARPRNPGKLSGDVDQNQRPSNMSKGAKAGPESQPIKRKQIDDPAVQSGTKDPASRVSARNGRARLKNKGPIYPSGPLAGGPNGRP